MLLTNLVASESIPIKKNETHYMYYIVFKNMHSGTEAILAFLISDYESLGLLYDVPIVKGI